MNNTILTDDKEIETLDLPHGGATTSPAWQPCSRPGSRGIVSCSQLTWMSSPASASRSTKSNDSAKTGLPPMDPLRQSFHSTTSKALNR